MFLEIDTQNKRLKIPSLSKEVGGFLSFIIALHHPKVIVEFGSGIGASVAWALDAFRDGSPKNLFELFVLTERRVDCCEAFQKLSWPDAIVPRLHFLAGDWDISKVSKVLNHKEVDLFIVDGQKSQYATVIEEIYPRMKVGGLVFIDNTNWENEHKTDNVRRALLEMNEFLMKDPRFKYVHLPRVGDGVGLLLKKEVH